MLTSKLQIRENVNKRIEMWENLVLFCLNCKKIDVKSPQVEKEKKKGMMDNNLRYVAAVTSLRGDLTQGCQIHKKNIKNIKFCNFAFFHKIIIKFRHFS